MSAALAPAPPTIASLISPRVALNAFFRIAGRWGLDRVQEEILLQVPERTLYRWKKMPDKATLSHDTLERISYMIGIFTGLHAIFTEGGYADAWIREPNAAFGGDSALQRMLAGNMSDLLAVRRHVDSVQYA